MTPARRAPRRGAFLMPTLLTTGNLVAGCLVLVMLLSHGEKAALACAIAIGVGAVLDGLDGLVARATGTSSDFGVEYDSMADLVTFGIAPAFLAYSYCLEGLGPVGAVAAVWYVMCAAIRLARFNSAEENRIAGFSGLPSPAAACTLASFVILVETLARFPISGFPAPALPWMRNGIAPAVLLMVAGLGALMISRVPYLAIKGVNTSRPRPMRTILAVLVFGFVVWSIPQLLFGLFMIYVFLGLVLRFLTSVRWAERVAPALVQWAEGMATPRALPANGKNGNANR